MMHQASVKVLPAHERLLAAASQPTHRHANRSFTERYQTRPIVIDPIVLIVPLKLRIERRPDFLGGSRQTGAKPALQLTHLHPKLLLRRFPLQFELACAAMAAVMREAEEVERARCAFA